jgi:hypothetical protein
VRENASGYALDLRFDAHPAGSTVAQLEEEVDLHRRHPVRGTLGPVDILVHGPQMRLLFPAFDPNARRLDHLVEGLSAAGMPLGVTLSAWLIRKLAPIVDELVRAGRRPDVTHPASVLVTGRGQIALLGTGSPWIQALLLGRRASVHSPTSTVRRLWYLLHHGGRCPDAWPGNPGRLDPEDEPLVGFTERLAPAQVEAEMVALWAAVSREYLPADAPRGAAVLAAPLAVLPEGGPSAAPLRPPEPPPATEPAPAPPASSPPRWDDPPHEPSDDTLVEAPDPRPAAAPSPTPVRADSGAGAGAGSGAGAEVGDWAAVLGESVDVPVLPAPTPTPASLHPPGVAPASTPAPPPALAPAAPSSSPAAASASASGDGGLPPEAEALSRQLMARLQAERTPPPSRQRTLSWVLVALLLFVAAGSWIAVTTQRVGQESLDEVVERPRPSPPAPAGDDPTPVPPRPGASAPPAPPKPVPEPLPLVSVMSKPSGARVEIDGTPAGATPLVLRRPLDRDTYRIRVTKPGYRAWEDELRPDPRSGGISVMVELRRR